MCAPKRDFFSATRARQLQLRRIIVATNFNAHCSLCKKHSRCSTAKSRFFLPAKFGIDENLRAAKKAKMRIQKTEFLKSPIFVFPQNRARQIRFCALYKFRDLRKRTRTRFFRTHTFQARAQCRHFSLFENACRN